MLQRDGMVMVEMKVLVMVMMIPMKSGAMAMMMATISPPRQIPACRRAFLSLVFYAPQRRRSLSLMPPFCLGFRGR
jgi:hypothetical protein